MKRPFKIQFLITFLIIGGSASIHFIELMTTSDSQINSNTLNKIEQSSQLIEQDILEDTEEIQSHNYSYTQNRIHQNQNSSNRNSDFNIEDQLKFAIDHGIIEPNQKEEFRRQWTSVEQLINAEKQSEETEILDEESISI